MIELFTDHVIFTSIFLFFLLIEAPLAALTILFGILFIL